jgi:hypothetical protein
MQGVLPKLIIYHTENKQSNLANLISIEAVVQIDIVGLQGRVVNLAKCSGLHAYS